MGSSPLISVCIPSYNNGGSIAFTLESILKQTYSNFEIIVTDDNSTDGTVAVIKRFADPRIRLVQNEVNLGMGGNWNRAVSYAAGKYIKLVCGDDVLYPACLERQTEILEHPANVRAALAICNSHVINANNEIVLQRRAHFGSGLVSGKALVRRCVRWGTNLIGEPVVGLFRRDLLAPSVKFDPSNPYLIDLAFWAALLKHGDAFVDPNRLAAFRVSASSVSAQVGRKQAACFRRFAQNIHHDSAYRTSRLDVMLGTVLSLQWCFLRNLFIHLQARRTAAKLNGI